MRGSRDSDRRAGLLSVQRALQHRITPSLRAVAVKVDKPVIWTRFVYDGEPTSAERELADATGDEVAAGLAGRWLSQVLVRSAAPDDVLLLESGEEWVYARPERDSS